MAALRTRQAIVFVSAAAALLAAARVLVIPAVAQVFRNISAVGSGVICVRAIIAAANDRFRVVAIIEELRRCTDQRAQTILTERVLLGG